MGKKTFYSWLCLVPKRETFSHFSHGHPLELTSLFQAGDDTICSGCNSNITAGREYYTCKTCNFSLHRTCFDMPRTFQHLADPGHDLDLLFVSPFDCKACGLQGSGFSYHCSECLVDYHLQCSQMPLTLIHSSHPHQLHLEFSLPYGNNPRSFRCYECGNRGFDQWFYRCSGCEFNVHLNCVSLASRAQSQPPNPANHPSPVHREQPSGNRLSHYLRQNSPPPAARESPTMTADSSSSTSPDDPRHGTQPNQPCHGSSPHCHHRKKGVPGLVVNGIATGFGEGLGQQASKGLVGLMGKLIDKVK